MGPLTHFRGETVSEGRIYEACETKTFFLLSCDRDAPRDKDEFRRFGQGENAIHTSPTEASDSSQAKIAWAMSVGRGWASSGRYCAIVSTIPIGCGGEPEEIAKAALFLASDDSVSSRASNYSLTAPERESNRQYIGMKTSQFSQNTVWQVQFCSRKVKSSQFIQYSTLLCSYPQSDLGSDSFLATTRE
jgi:hypothetical protein